MSKKKKVRERLITFSLIPIRIIDSKYIKTWKSILRKLIELCFEVSQVASPIVNSSSPEGIFPTELDSSKIYEICKLLLRY
jgi:hypothetical protein